MEFRTALHTQHKYKHEVINSRILQKQKSSPFYRLVSKTFNDLHISCYLMLFLIDSVLTKSTTEYQLSVVTGLVREFGEGRLHKILRIYSLLDK